MVASSVGSSPGPRLLVAESDANGAVRVSWRAGSVETEIESALQGSSWSPFALRGVPQGRAAQAGALREVTDGLLPRLEVRPSVQLIHFHGVDDGRRGGVAAVTPAGVDVLLEWENAVLAEDGVVTSPGGGHLALGVSDAEYVREVFLVDLGDTPPVLTAVETDASEIRPESLALTNEYLFFAAERDDGEWVYRYPLSSPPLGGPFAGPYDKLQRGIAAAPDAAAFVAGPKNDELEVYVVVGAGAPRNISRAPGEYVRHEPGQPRLAVSAGGRFVAYQLETEIDDELFLHDTAVPGPSGRLQITEDSRFNPYLDQESFLFFARQYLVFDAGHDDETQDMFRVDLNQFENTINLTRTGSSLEPPFLTKGTLEVLDSILATDDVLMVEANSLDSPSTLVTLVSVSSGETLSPALEVAQTRNVLQVGGDLFFQGFDAGGGGALHRVNEGGMATVVEGSSDALSYVGGSGEGAYFSVRGEGLLRVGGGTSEWTAVTEGDLSAGCLSDDGRHLACVRLVDGLTEYLVVDLESGSLLAYPGLAAPTAVLSVGAIFELFVRGDSNADGAVDLSDSIFTLSYLFLGGPDPDCLDAADADDSGEILITDAIYALQALFAAGSTIPDPYPYVGTDATPDTLGCAG